MVRAACDWIKRPFCVSAQLNTAHTTYYIAEKRRRTNFTRIKYIAENYIDAHSITNSRNCQFGVDFFVSIQNLTHTHTFVLERKRGKSNVDMPFSTTDSNCVFHIGPNIQFISMPMDKFTTD